MKQPTIEELETRLDQFRKELDALKQPSPEVLEDNCWYVHNEVDQSICFKSETGTGYGFWREEWRNKIYCNSPALWRKATESDLLPLFTKEAERKYKLGDEIKRSWVIKDELDEVVNIDGGGTFFDLGSNYFEFKGRRVFDNGQWAEVIKEPITVGGFEVAYNRDNIVVNGKVIWKAFLETVSANMKDYCIQSVRLFGEDVDLTKMELLLKGFEGE